MLSTKPTCPMCKKQLRGVERQCANCKTDVSLLVDYVQHLREGLLQAEAYTRAGELGEAVWAYLDVLEIDPDNASARQQVGKVVTAVRQFDQEAPGRRWFKRIQKETRFRRWMARMNENEGSDLTGWLNGIFWFLLLLAVLVLGYVMGVQSAKPATGETPGINKEKDKEKDKSKEIEKEKEKGRGANAQ